MIEAIGIPILLKAIDFLFGEGSKILQERRERRKAGQKAAKVKPEIATPPSTKEAKVANIINSKKAALSEQIPKSKWVDSEAEIKHLMSLLEIHTRNYYLAREQYAKWGSALVPPIIVNNLSEAENAVATTMKDLQTTLSKVYGKKIIAPEVVQA